MSGRATRKASELSRFGFGGKFIVRISSSLQLNNKARQFISVIRTTQPKNVQETQPKKVKQRRNTVAESANINQNIETCNSMQEREASTSSKKTANRRKSVGFNSTVKVFDFMNIPKKNIPFSLSRPRLTTLNGEGCSHWSDQSDNENHDTEDLVSTSHISKEADVLPANHAVSPVDSSIDLKTVAESIDEVDSNVSVAEKDGENHVDLPNIDTPHEFRPIPESLSPNEIELIDLQDSTGLITTETVGVLIDFDSTSEIGNDESSGQMVQNNSGQKLIDVDSFDENLNANQRNLMDDTSTDFIDNLLGFNDEPMNGNVPLIQPMVPNVGESRKLVRRQVPDLLPIKKRRMSIGMVIASICDDYDAQYVLPNDEKNKKKDLMEIDFDAEYSFGKMD